MRHQSSSVTLIASLVLVAPATLCTCMQECEKKHKEEGYHRGEQFLLCCWLLIWLLMRCLLLSQTIFFGSCDVTYWLLCTGNSHWHRYSRRSKIMSCSLDWFSIWRWCDRCPSLPTAHFQRELELELELAHITPFAPCMYCNRSVHRSVHSSSCWCLPLASLDCCRGGFLKADK